MQSVSLLDWYEFCICLKKKSVSQLLLYKPLTKTALKSKVAVLSEVLRKGSLLVIIMPNVNKVSQFYDLKTTLIDCRKYIVIIEVKKLIIERIDYR